MNSENHSASQSDHRDHQKDDSLHSDRLSELMNWTIRIRSVALTGLFLLAVFYTLYVAREIILPIILALLLNFLFRPIIRGLKRFHIPPVLGAALLLLGLLGVVGFTFVNLAGPATEWMSTMRNSVPEIGDKVRGLLEPLHEVTKAAEQMEDVATGGREGAKVEVHVKRPSVLNTLLMETWRFGALFFLMFLLLYFILAYEDLFLRKLIKVFPRFSDKRRVLEIANDIERGISSYLVTVTLMNTGVGIFVGLTTYFVGFPNPVLWGVMAGLLEFIPYLGPLAGITAVTLVGILTFDSLGQAFLGPLIYLIMEVFQGNFIATMIYGHRFSLNPVVILVWLIFWGWLWGVPGALLAVPMLTAFKIFCDHVEPLSTLADFMGM